VANRKNKLYMKKRRIAMPVMLDILQLRGLNIELKRMTAKPPFFLFWRKPKVEYWAYVNGYPAHKGSNFKTAVRGVWNVVVENRGVYIIHD
jgi:hypothetical protein